MSEKSLMIVNAVLNPDEKVAFAYYAKYSAPLFQEAGANSYRKTQNI